MLKIKNTVYPKGKIKTFAEWRNYIKLELMYTKIKSKDKVDYSVIKNKK